MARSLIQAHDRVKSLDWDLSYAERPVRYETRYHIPSKSKDPFRQLLRDFLAMEAEKDDRAYGGLLDVLARTDAVNKADPAFSEILKALLPALRDGEYYAMQCMMILGETVNNAELCQGYLAQELDEVRHVQSEAWLSRYYAKHYHDPAGFNIGPKVREWNPFLMAVRAGLSQFIANDPIMGCLNLQVVGETAYTNPLFVAMTEVAARSGDTVLPSLFLSIQSDEGRHMANGYATLTSVLQDDRNMAFLQDDLDEAMWRNHRPFDLLLGIVFDYFRDSKVDTKPYREYWDQWLWHDYAGSYMGKLEKFGIKAPTCLPKARNDVYWMGHTGAMFLYALWPLNFWRTPPLPESAFDWYEHHYPGWYSYFGPFWEDAHAKSDPANRSLAMEAFAELPPLCRVCLLPCVLPRIDISEVHIEEHGGRNHAFCSTICQDIFHKNPGQYLEHVNFGEKYHGWDLADVIEDWGLLREDGKTLVGQPHLSLEKMWTIDDIRAIGWEINYPLADNSKKYRFSYA
ncbi:MAG: monooxygenase [Actinomycetota bacterium]